MVIIKFFAKLYLNLEIDKDFLKSPINLNVASKNLELNASLITFIKPIENSAPNLKSDFVKIIF